MPGTLALYSAAEFNSPEFIRPPRGAWVLVRRDFDWKLYFYTKIQHELQLHSLRKTKEASLAHLLENKSLAEAKMIQPSLLHAIQLLRIKCLSKGLGILLDKLQLSIHDLYDEKEALEDFSYFKDKDQAAGDAEFSSFPDQYEKWASQYIDYIVFEVFDRVAIEAMQKEPSFELLAFKHLLDFLNSNYIIQASRYLGAERVPRITSDRLFEKMLWVEWFFASLDRFRKEKIIKESWLLTNLDSHLNSRWRGASFYLRAYVERQDKQHLKEGLLRFQQSYMIPTFEEAYTLAYNSYLDMKKLISKKELTMTAKRESKILPVEMLNDETLCNLVKSANDVNGDIARIDAKLTNSQNERDVINAKRSWWNKIRGSGIDVNALAVRGVREKELQDDRALALKLKDIIPQQQASLEAEIKNRDLKKIEKNYEIFWQHINDYCKEHPVLDSKNQPKVDRDKARFFESIKNLLGPKVEHETTLNQYARLKVCVRKLTEQAALLHEDRDSVFKRTCKIALSIILAGIPFIVNAAYSYMKYQNFNLFQPESERLSNFAKSQFTQLQSTTAPVPSKK